jgi:hypothetical protein
MKTPEAELARLWAHNRALEEEKARLLWLNEGLEAQFKEALLELAEFKRQLFGEKSEKLTLEKEGQLAEVAADLQEQLQRDPPASDDVMEDEAHHKPKEPPKRRPRRRRHPFPEHLERQTLDLEPERLDACPHCGQAPESIGQETSEKLDYVPAKVVVRQTVRPKYACRCGCGGVHIAPLPPRLLPQSKLGLGMAVHLLAGPLRRPRRLLHPRAHFPGTSRGGLPRQQMVQWVAHIAFLLQPPAA